jgi:heme A synthase
MSRLTEGIRRANERDREFIMSLNLHFLEKVLLPLYAAFLCLDFMDVYSTLLAMKSSFDFRELNPIASALFSLHFNGYLLAIAFKYLPAIPLFYLVFAKDRSGTRAFEIRLLRFVGLVSLVAADGVLGYIVVWNNLPALLALFG